ncbi:ABC transporter substrate-binding protein [Ideonella sp. A 288]|uniref:cytochrome c/ABC transporter substrate-binding protein n=1 Tax=Ideonella sp. A 288 TaxID=1962181 RepID=UPI000B4B3F1C|nr:ABC transporter substrate-binding protein [Ideonella sp. A 288]
MTGLRKVGAALLAAALACGAMAAGLTPQEEAGRRIYLQGDSPSGSRISARVGVGAGFELTGQSIACGNCHGEDGRGRIEGGIVPANIQWTELIKPYGHQHENGRRHGPFDEDSLRRSIVEGVDPDGNKLDSSMPRYSMSEKDFVSLAAYLKKLENQLDTGLGPEVIRVGTLLPIAGRMATLGEALRDLWSAYFASINDRGGIHGRKLELVVQGLPEDPQQAQAAARALVTRGGVFAVLAPVSAGVERALAEAAGESQVPVIGPLTLFPEDAQTSNQYVFHLLPGVTELAQTLARHAQRELKLADRPLVLWHSDTADGRASAKSLEATLRQAGWRSTVAMPYLARGASHDALAASLKQRAAAAVLVLGPGGDVQALATSAARIGWTPHLLVPGTLASRDILALPAAFRDHVTLAYPTSPANQRSDAMQEFSALLQGRGESRALQSSLVNAYAAGLLFVEGLKRTGRDLSRRKLTATIESVSGFETGLLPQLSYNADKRIGSMGAYLVGVDLDSKSLRPLGGYQLP